MIHFWLLALRNLQRNSKRNFATGSAIALGFAGIIFLGAYANRTRHYLEALTVYVLHTGHIAIYAPEGFEKSSYKPLLHSLGGEDQAAIEGVLRHLPNVDFFERQIRGQGLVGNGCLSLPFSAQGIDPAVDKLLKEHEQVKKWIVPPMQFFRQGQGLWNYPDSLGAVLLSKSLALSLGKTKVHDDYTSWAVSLTNCSDPNYKEKMNADANVQLFSGTWEGNLSAVDGESVGIYSSGYKEADNFALFAPVSLLQKLYDTTKITQYSVWLKDPAQVGITLAALNAAFKDAGKNFETLRWDEERLSPYYVGTITFLNVIVLSVALVLTVIIALSVFNSVTMTILERSQEIGMYRSMGFRRSHVRSLYLQESIWLSILSLATGSGIGALGIFLVNQAKIIYYPPGMPDGLQLILILHSFSAAVAALIIFLVVLLTTYITVSIRLRLRPADLLGGVLR